ncbi:MAG: hypothetical protein JJE03_01825 [Peptostreptococcaceae bacterium]|nr:hypothetical protein [Peptostreptococcaceae bacterium]
MKNLIIIIGTIILGTTIVGTFILGDGDNSLKVAAENVVANGISAIDSVYEEGD